MEDPTPPGAPSPLGSDRNSAVCAAISVAGGQCSAADHDGAAEYLAKGHEDEGRPPRSDAEAVGGAEGGDGRAAAVLGIEAEDESPDGPGYPQDDGGEGGLGMSLPSGQR